MTKQTENGTFVPIEAFFWLGEEGDLEGLTEEEFKMKQETWNGQRPMGNEQDVGGNSV